MVLSRGLRAHLPRLEPVSPSDYGLGSVRYAQSAWREDSSLAYLYGAKSRLPPFPPSHSCPPAFVHAMLMQISFLTLLVSTSLAYPKWPTSAELDTFNASVDGLLFAQRPIRAICYEKDPLFNPALCAAELPLFFSDQWIANQSAA
jgi:hypothetical protein